MLRRAFAGVLSSLGLLSGQPMQVQARDQKKELVGRYKLVKWYDGRVIRYFAIRGEIADMNRFWYAHAIHSRDALIADNPQLKDDPHANYIADPIGGEFIGMEFNTNSRRNDEAVEVAIRQTGCRIVNSFDED